MNKISNAIAAIAAGGVIAGGGAIYYMGGDTTPETAQTEAVDDVVAVSVALPVVNVPVVNVPAVAKPVVNVPAVAITRFLTELEITELKLPETVAANVIRTGVSVPTTQGNIVILPSASGVRITLPGAQTETVITPEPGETIIVIPSPQGEIVYVPSASGGVVAIPTPQGYKIVIPEVTDPAARIPQVIALQKLLQRLFRDKRNLAYDKSIGIDSTAWQKWIAIYQKNEDYEIEFHPIQKGLRIVSEVKCPRDSAQINTLDRNLEAYKTAGYNAVLLTFDLTEPLAKLLDVISLIKSKEMSVLFSYAGPERLEWSVFQDPDKLANYLSSIGAASDAFVLGWRRTALHLLIPDPQWINFLVKHARRYHKELPLIGEAYLGQTAESNESERAITYNIPENCSAVLIFGIGYPNIALERVMDRVFPLASKYDRIGLAIGPKPYYDTRNNMGISRQEAARIKRGIEERFLRAGCVATMTLHGDGSDGIYDKSVTENLSMPYKNEEVSKPQTQ